MPLGLGRGQQTTTTVQVAGGADRSTAVLVLGGSLLFVNLIFGTDVPAVAWLFGNRNPGAIPRWSWGINPLLGVLAVFLLLLLSKTGEVGGNLAVLFLVAVWIVWLLNKPDAVAKLFGQASSSTSSKTSGATK
jgi:hypothetical protein